MPLSPTSHATEAILAFGSNGSGKSRGWGRLLQWYADTDTPGHFYVIGTETGALDRMRDGYPCWDERVTAVDCLNWLEVVRFTETFVDQLAPGDWVVIEGLGKPWEYVRGYYDETRPGYKPRGSAVDPFAIEVEPTRNWDSIKSVYYAWLNSLLNSKAHVYACAHEDVLRVEGGWKDSDAKINTYKYIGVKAVTEKTAEYAFHTVLWMRRTGARAWTVTTVDDHEREYLDNAAVGDFAMDYLLGPAGWQIT